MKYIKIFEGYRPPFKSDIGKKMSEINLPFKSFQFTDLSRDCKKYDVNFEKLVNEMLLNKKLSFQSYYFMNTRMEDIDVEGGPQLGVCEDIKILEGEWQSDSVFVKLENDDKWCLLPFKRKTRIYGYEEGPTIQELESKKMAEIYNL